MGSISHAFAHCLLQFGLNRLSSQIPGRMRQLTVALRQLRQRVVGVSALQPGGDAPRARGADFRLIGLDDIRGLAIILVRQPAAHRIAQCALFKLLAELQIGAGRLGHCWRKAVRLQLLQRC